MVFLQKPAFVTVPFLKLLVSSRLGSGFQFPSKFRDRRLDSSNKRKVEVNGKCLKCFSQGSQKPGGTLHGIYLGMRLMDSLSVFHPLLFQGW